MNISARKFCFVTHDIFINKKQITFLFTKEIPITDIFNKII